MVVDVDGARVATAAYELNAEGFLAAGARTGDVAKPEDAERMIDETEAKLGQISVLVNNVGVFVPEPNRAEEVDFEQWRSVIDVNINGTYLMCQRVGRRMIVGGVDGAIVNIASIYGMRALDSRLYGVGRNPPRYDDASYHVSKAAVIQLTKTLAVSWAPFGIRVNSVSPGPIETASNREVMQPGIFRKIAGRTPLGRLGSPEGSRRSSWVPRIPQGQLCHRRKLRRRWWLDMSDDSSAECLLKGTSSWQQGSVDGPRTSTASGTGNHASPTSTCSCTSRGGNSPRGMRMKRASWQRRSA